MDELIKLVTQKAGITEQQARTAIETVAQFAKERLPAPLAGQLDAVLKGGSPDLGSLGGLFGKK
jgi:hypothetical protein